MKYTFLYKKIRHLFIYVQKTLSLLVATSAMCRLRTNMTYFPPSFTVLYKVTSYQHKTMIRCPSVYASVYLYSFYPGTVPYGTVNMSFINIINKLPGSKIVNFFKFAKIASFCCESVAKRSVLSRIFSLG